MSDRLLDAATLFQQLLMRDLDSRFAIASDLDVGSFDEIPIVTHYTLLSQTQDGEWSGTLTVNLYLDPATAFEHANDVYRVIRGWNVDPETTIVPDVGAVETIEDLNAFTPVSGVVTMNNKAVRQYQGSFAITASVH